jgi:hypothetical protein
LTTTSLICCALLVAVCASAPAATPADAAAPAAAAPDAPPAPVAPSGAAVTAPATTAAAAHGAAAAAAPTTAPAGAQATATGSPADSTAAERADLQKFARNHGYKPFGTGDKTTWCRNEAPLGSRLERQVCVKEAALADLRRQYELNKDDMQRNGQTCAGMACGKN